MDHSSLVAELNRRAVDSGFCGVGYPEGWDSVVEEFVVAASRVAPDFEVAQVKDKFAALRLYVNSGSDDPLVSALFHTLARRAEDRSAHTCEVCGAPGRTRHTGWIRVLCPLHADEPMTVADRADVLLADLGISLGTDTLWGLSELVDARLERLAGIPEPDVGDVSPEADRCRVQRERLLDVAASDRALVDALNLPADPPPVVG